MEYQEMLHRCFRCGWCKFPENYSEINCPSYLKYSFESFSPGGRLWLTRAWMNGEIEASDRFKKIVYSCATCKNCVTNCAIPEIKEHLVDMVIGARQEIVSTGKLPAPVRDYFMEIYNNGNPFKAPQSSRGDWNKAPDIPMYSNEEYLFYVGDVGSFDETGIAMTRAVASVLKDAGVSIGILGEEEVSDGNDVKAMGEKDLFTRLAEKNIALFNNKRVTKIITLSPHAYNTMKNDYPEFDGCFEVYHYTEILAVIRGQLSPGTLPVKVTYHDPCYLGRWNNSYGASRALIQAIPGIEFIEMERNNASSLCCGGGGGNYYSDMLGSGVHSPGRTRVREAKETGAEIIVVSCPLCYKMLDDAIKDEGFEDSMRVMDIAQLILESKQ
ncbi:MAG: (Fe-S)-binding protein [bacterium]|nr:(Fe-S)-binding protein [bacterium]